jgi:hypothetical protein
MTQITQILEHRFPSGADWDIAGLSVSLDDLAARLGIELQGWDEDGLGAARGTFIRLPSGRIVLIRELAHVAKHLGWRGTDIVADAGDLVALGVGPLIDEVVSVFGLSDGVIAWAAGEDARRSAAEVLQAWRVRQTRE